MPVGPSSLYRGLMVTLAVLIGPAVSFCPGQEVFLLGAIAVSRCGDERKRFLSYRGLHRFIRFHPERPVGVQGGKYSIKFPPYTLTGQPLTG